MSVEKKQVLLMAGPTASGKSALALAIARVRPSLIINADSMQVYRDLHILSARPDLDDLKVAPHSLYGHVPAAHAYSTVEWLSEALEQVERAKQAGLLPILVGGTGLYFNSLLRGMAVIPPIPDIIRTRVRQEIAQNGAEQAHERLKTIDSLAAARLEPGDRQRIARALEVFEASGRCLSDFQMDTKPGPLAGVSVCLKLESDRTWLYGRINQRLDSMIEKGALAEVEALKAGKLDANLPAMKALGVSEFGAYLAGEQDLETAKLRVKQQTRQFAKRQMTWFRNQFKDWYSVNSENPAKALADGLSFLNRHNIA